MTMWRGFCVIGLSCERGGTAGLMGPEPLRRPVSHGADEISQRSVTSGDHELVVGVDDPHPPLQGEPGGEVDRRRFQLGDEYVSLAGGPQLVSEPRSVRQRGAVTDDGGAVRL